MKNRCIRTISTLIAVVVAMTVFAPIASAGPKDCSYDKKASGWYWQADGACATGGAPDAYKPYDGVFFDTSDVGLQTPPGMPEGLMTIDYDFASGTVDFSMGGTYLMDGSADAFGFSLEMSFDAPGSAEFSLYLQGSGADEMFTITGTLSVGEDGQQVVTVSDGDLAALANQLGISKEAALSMVTNLVQAGGSNAEVAVDETKGDAKKANAEGGSDAGTEGGSDGDAEGGSDQDGASPGVGDVGGAMADDR